jgi:hypothetical protein
MHLSQHRRPDILAPLQSAFAGASRVAWDSSTALATSQGAAALTSTSADSGELTRSPLLSPSGRRVAGSNCALGCTNRVLTIEAVRLALLAPLYRCHCQLWCH